MILWEIIGGVVFELDVLGVYSASKQDILRWPTLSDSLYKCYNVINYLAGEPSDSLILTFNL